MSDEDAAEEEVHQSEKDIGGFIDVASANRRVWLVKVPDFFARRLEDIEGRCEEGVDVYVGSVRTVQSTSGGGTDSKLMIHLDEQGPMADLPSDYHLQSFKPTQQMHLLVQSAQTEEALGIQGKVEQECHMIPVLEDERYRTLLRARTEAANRPKRTIQLVDEHHRAGMVEHVSEHSLLAGQAKRRTEPEMRRERLPRGEVINMLFKAFERYERMSLGDLLTHTQQPAAYLKEILAEIAIYNKRGPNKNLYELLSEYQRKET